MTLFGPTPISVGYDLASFASGEASLDLWLRERALANERHGAARTLVIVEGDRVRGYFALAAGSVSATESQGRFRRNMPDPVPVVILGRFALDRSLHGRGWGAALFYDAATRVLAVAETVGVRGMLVHAISASARDFYLRMGMRVSPLSPMTLLATCDDLRAATGGQRP